LGFSFAATQTLKEPLLVIGITSLAYIHLGLRGADVATLVASLTLFYRAMSETNALGNHWFTVSETSSGLNSVLGYSEMFRDNKEQDGTTELSVTAPEIGFDSVSFSYSDTPVLNDVSMTIPAGSTTAFIGRSGAGKSTFVNILIGLLKPQAGEISINGIPLTQIKSESYRSQIGYVTQDTVLFNASISSNITMRFEGDYSEAELAELERVCRLSDCWEFVHTFANGLATIIGESGGTLSGGQRQRIVLARELYRRPKLLILDESTSSLDIVSEKAVFDNIRALRGELTLIVISHRSSAIEGVDNIFLIEDSSIIKCNDPSDAESYQNIFLQAFRANQKR
jgi:ABC-type multidrug transport system fused ATPase/permease subunit